MIGEVEGPQHRSLLIGQQVLPWKDIIDPPHICNNTDGSDDHASGETPGVSCVKEVAMNVL